MDLANKVGLGRGSAMLQVKAPKAPVVVKPLADLTLATGLAVADIDLSGAFAGRFLTFTLAPFSAPLPSALSLSTGGIVSGIPQAESGPSTIVIRATNAQGSAETAFQLTVEDVEPDFNATLSGLSANATHGPSARTGILLTAEPSGYTMGVPETVEFQWQTVESGPIAGATSVTFTPDAFLHDGESLSCLITPSGYPAKSTESVVIRHHAPQSLGTPIEEFFDEATGDQVLDMAPFFEGEAVTYSATGPGVSIDAGSGMLTISTDSAVIGAMAVVTATNTGGSASVNVPFSVEGLDVGAGPELAMPVLDDVADSVTLTLDSEATVYWRRDASGTNPAAGDVILGGGFDSGSLVVPEGGTSIDLVFAPGNDGLQQISFVAVDPEMPDETSVVRTVAITIDTVAPSIAFSAPASGSTGAPVDGSIVLSYDEDVVAGAGTYTLRDVTDAVDVAVFDVVAASGSGPGQVSVVGSDVTLTLAADLQAGHAYVVLADAGVVRDLAGNAAVALSAATGIDFSTQSPALVVEAFDAGFATRAPALWSSMQTNVYNATMEHRPDVDWSAYGATSAGGVVAVKSGSYAQIRFSVPVIAGRSYAVDADVPVGLETWNGPLRFKLGSTLSDSDYLQVDEPSAGQPRLVQIRGASLVATTSELWVAIIVETSTSSSTGGHPALSYLRVTEI